MPRTLNRPARRYAIECQTEGLLLSRARRRMVLKSKKAGPVRDSSSKALIAVILVGAWRTCGFCGSCCLASPSSLLIGTLGLIPLTWPCCVLCGPFRHVLGECCLLKPRLCSLQEPISFWLRYLQNDKTSSWRDCNARSDGHF